MTPDLPIDIVYTWVNGSDPRLLSELKVLRQKVIEQEEKYVFLLIVSLCDYHVKGKEK